MELQFNVSGQIISRADNKTVVADSRKYISLKFTFSEEWNGTNKTAVITTNNITYYALINADGIVNADDMPIIKSGLCYFSVFGGDTQDIAQLQTTDQLQTANELFINILPSGLKEGEFPEPPPEEVYQQIYNKAQSAEEIAQSVRDDADNGVFNGEKGEKGDTGSYYTKLLYEVIEAPYPTGIPTVIEGNKIELIGHPFLNDDFIEFSAGDGTLPTEIYNKSFWIYNHSKLTFYNRAFYFVVNKTDNDFQISDTKGGTPVTISLTGSNFKVRLAGSKRSAYFSFAPSTHLKISIRGAIFNPTGSSNGGLSTTFYDGYSNIPGMNYRSSSTWWAQPVITTGINSSANQFGEFCIDFTVEKDAITRFYNGDFKAYILQSTTFAGGVTPSAITVYGKFKLTNYFSSYYETISRIQLRTEMGDSATNIFLNGTIVEVFGGSLCI